METMKKKVDPSMQRLDWHHHPFIRASNTDDRSVSCIFLSPYPSQNDPLKLASDMSYFHITREEMESQNGYETSSKDTWPVWQSRR